jgi:hypothetical protein
LRGRIGREIDAVGEVALGQSQRNLIRPGTEGVAYFTRGPTGVRMLGRAIADFPPIEKHWIGDPHVQFKSHI